jgi:hypothetical protein
LALHDCTSDGKALKAGNGITSEIDQADKYIHRQ